jgi:hypothetical protein
LFDLLFVFAVCLICPMTTTITVSASEIDGLNLAPALAVIEPLLAAGAIASQDPQLRFVMDYPRDQAEDLELSEIPEVRLWFIRLDATYPWLPYLLDWRSGELARYFAMLVPHQFSPKEGIQFNPQALDILVMQKIFILHDWLKRQNLEGVVKLKQMAELFGYELNDGLFELLG